MKNWLFFGGGVLVGAALTLLIVFLVVKPRQQNVEMADESSQAVEREEQKQAIEEALPGLKLFGEPGQVFAEGSVRVLQSIGGVAELVNGKGKYGDYFGGQVYLLMNDEEKYYYDEEIIKISSSQELVQIGVYTYTNGMGMQKTVPVVIIRNK